MTAAQQKALPKAILSYRPWFQTKALAERLLRNALRRCSKRRKAIVAEG
jgi:hypothetical protein